MEGGAAQQVGQRGENRSTMGVEKILGAGIFCQALAALPPFTRRSARLFRLLRSLLESLICRVPAKHQVVILRISQRLVG